LSMYTGPLPDPNPRWGPSWFSFDREHACPGSSRGSLSGTPLSATKAVPVAPGRGVARAVPAPGTNPLHPARLSTRSSAAQTLPAIPPFIHRRVSFGSVCRQCCATGQPPTLVGRSNIGFVPLDQSPESALSACRTIGSFSAPASSPWFAAADEMASAVTATERLPSTMRSIASVTWSAAERCC